MIPNETIYALSSGQLPAAIAVIRISGSKTKEIMSLIIGHTPNERILELVKIKAVSYTHLTLPTTPYV